MTLSFSPGHGHLSAVDVDWDVHYAQSKTPAVDAAPRVRSRDQTAHVPFGTHYDFTRVTLPSPHSLATLPLPSHNMPKKRPSLQSLFIPSKFLSPSNASSPAHVSHDANASLPATPVPVSLRLRTLSEALRPAHARQESSSSIASSYAGSLHRDLDLSPLEISTPGGSPPAEDLLPDDPFAAASFPSHSPSPSLSASTLPPPLASPALPPPPPPSTPAPHSPLSASFQDRDRPSSMVRRPSLRQSASASILASPKIRPAHTRPAFSPRPSLPSLRVLARTTVMVKKKVKKGTPGARLPLEPWDNDEDDVDDYRSSQESYSSQSSGSSLSSREPSPTPSNRSSYEYASPISSARPASAASDSTTRVPSPQGPGIPTLDVRPVSRFELDFSSPYPADGGLAVTSMPPTSIAPLDFTLSLRGSYAGEEMSRFPSVLDEPSLHSNSNTDTDTSLDSSHSDVEGDSGFTTPALTFSESSCAVSPEAEQMDFRWGSRDGLAYLASDADSPDRGDQHEYGEITQDRASSSSSTCERKGPAAKLDASDSMPLDTGAYSGAPSHSSVSSHAHGAAPARALYISSSPLALPDVLPTLPDVSDAVRRSRSRSPTTLFWAPRASEDVLRSGDGTSWHSPGPMGSQGRELKTEDGFIDAESIDGGLLRGGDAVADPTADPVFPGVDSEDRCESASRLISASISTSRATERLSVESGEGYKPLPPLPLPLPSSPSLIAADSGFVRFPTSGVDMPKQYSVHDADAGTEYSETGRTEFFDALSDVGSDSTIRGGYVRVDPDVLKGYRDRAQGPPGGWPEERASTYGFVHAGVERDRKGSAATITGTGRQRVVSSLAPAKRLSMASQKEGAQASGGAPASRARRESATPSMASARPSAASPVTSRMRKDSLSVTKPAPAPQSQSSRSSVATPVPPASQRASCASASTEKDRGSHVPVSVRASTGPHQRNTFGVQSPAPPPKDRFSSSKLSIPGRERKESISHITSDSVSASATASIAIDTTVNYNHNNASSSRQSSPSTPHSTSGGSSSSTSPPPIPPRSGRRPSYDSGRRAGGAAAIDREKDRTGSVVGVGDSSSSASPAGTTPATTPQREEDMPMLVAASVSVHTAPGLKSPLLSESVKRPAHSRTRSASVSRGNAKYYGEVTQDPLASPSGSPTPPTSGAVRAFVFSPGDAERGRVSYDSFSTNGTGAGGALGKKNGSAFTGLWQYDSEAMDGEDRGYRGGSGGKPDGSGYSSHWSYGGGSAAGNGRSNGRSNGAGAGGRDDEDDGERGRRRPPGPSSFSDSEDSDSSLSDSDDVGDENKTEITDDDVPLAQSIPTALKAQKTIRRQVKDERKHRKRDRLEPRQDLRHESSWEDPRQRMGGVNRAFRADEDDVAPRGRETARPMRSRSVRPQAVDPPAFAPLSPLPVASGHRPRTKTLPGTTTSPFSPDELAKKLMNVKVAGAPPSSVSRPPSNEAEGGSSGGFFKKFSRPSSRDGENGGGNLMARMRSVRHPKDVTAAASNGPQSLVRNGTVRAGPTSRRTSAEREEERGRTTSSSTGYKSGVDRARSMSRPRAAPAPDTDLPPPPPLPAVLRQNVNLVQQRVFVGDLQRFHTVEIGPTTTAEDVVKSVGSQGGLEDIGGSGGWMLWEVAQDFGMDRPVRSFELLQDIFASWNKDKMVNTLMIKRTLLEPILRRSALPTASPMCRGYVEYEVKRGKWNKRWLELREHSLYLAKRDNGKDETFLCSLSNFDAYHVRRLHKAPKPYTFAVKSTDNLSFFENTADYVHIFSVPEKEGQMWMEKILLARSYMLIQERTVLMSKTGGLNGTSSGSKGLARAPTRKLPPKTSQTLVAPPSPAVFEPGSLLAKR